MVSLMYRLDKEKIYSGIENAVEDLNRKIVLKAMSLVPGVNKRECIVSCITDEVISMMMSGVFSNHYILSDEMVAQIESTIKVPEKTKLTFLHTMLEKLYQKDPAKRAVEIVASLVSDDYVAGSDITKLINDFLLCEDESFVESVRKQLT